MGPFRWKRPMAEALSAAGALRAYVTPIASTPAREARLRAHVPDQVARRIEPHLRLRRAPEGVSEAQIRRIAVGSTLLQGAGLRLSRTPRTYGRILDVSGAWFDRAVARSLQDGDRVVIPTAGTALKTLEAARRHGIVSVLDYPTAHCDFIVELLTEERRRAPDFAATVPLEFFNPVRLGRLRAEMAAADRILVLSGFARDTFVERGVPADRLVLTHHGVDLDLFQPVPPGRADDGRFRVLFAGQITQLKGISYALEGFERAAIPASELTFMGAVRGDPDVWRSRPNVRHQPPVPFFEMPDHYRGADVFLMPSLCEGFPQTPILAMACGLPCIVSEHTFGTDVITDGVDGFIVPIRDPEAIAERLLALHRDPDLGRRVGAAARQRAASFTWHRYGQRVVEVVSALDR